MNPHECLGMENWPWGCKNEEIGESAVFQQNLENSNCIVELQNKHRQRVTNL
jgi:hypothetical protein